MLNNNILIKKIPTIMNIKGIDNKKYNVSEYIRIKLYFAELASVALIKQEFHVIDNLTVTALIDINIIKPERISLDFDNDIVRFECCDDVFVSIKVYSYDK